MSGHGYKRTKALNGPERVRREKLLHLLPKVIEKLEGRLKNRIFVGDLDEYRNSAEAMKKMHASFLECELVHDASIIPFFPKYDNPDSPLFRSYHNFLREEKIEKLSRFLERGMAALKASFAEEGIPLPSALELLHEEHKGVTHTLLPKDAQIWCSVLLGAHMTPRVETST